MLRVLSQKGRSHYLHEGYLYRLTHTCAKTQVRTFRCVKRICAARLKRDGDGTFVSFGAAHNHLADPAELYRKAVMNDLKEMATDTVKPPAEIIQSATEGRFHLCLKAKPQISFLMRFEASAKK